ncbi:MAG TPA: tetratricopeptide repeat protein [Planctomycetota bacterium]|nr:tetratricopeptide repeat protein [Planctomycetota bacterium]
MMRYAPTVGLVAFVLSLPALALVASLTAPQPHRALLPQTRAREVPSPVDPKLYAALERCEDAPRDVEARSLYAILLTQKAREVGNAAYHVLAEKEARAALDVAPTHDGARSALAVALLGQHRFADALAFVRSLEGKTTWRLACEVDALSELGRYAEAVAAADRLVSFKPGTEAYTRIALLREIHGDPGGALEVWDHALQGLQHEGVDRAWTTAQIGDLQLRRGDVEAATAAYEESLHALPGYWLACVGLARCDVARGELARAEERLVPLMEAHGDVVTAALLGDVQELRGHADEAETTRERLLESEAASAALGAPDPRGLALFLADNERELERAVTLARSAERTAATIVNEDALAWALFRSGNKAEALEHARLALRTNTRNPQILEHAGEIALASGDAMGEAYLLKAMRGGLAADARALARARVLLSGIAR